jgi:hypothetical protein
MAGRWGGSLQPNAIPIVDAAGNVPFHIHDPERLDVGSRANIYPGEEEPLDVVARIGSDVECYGWNNETYFTQPFGRNKNWELGRDRFLVKVTITSSGQKREGLFVLVNDVPPSSFRLETATSDQIALVRQARP